MSTNTSNKILIISTEFPPGPGGIGSHAYSMAKALVKKGKEIIVLSPADFINENEFSSFDNLQNFKILRFPRIGWKTYFRRIQIINEVINSNKIVTVLLTGKFSLWMGFFLKLTRRKIVCTVVLHGSEVNLPNFLLRKLTHIAIYKADRIIAVSNFTRALLPQWIRKRRMVEIVPNGIDSEAFESFNDGMASEIEIKGNPKLLTVGHVTLRKGQQRVIKAIPELIKYFPDIHYHIVGRPVNEEKFTILAEELNVKKYITFHGRAETQSELVNFYKASDIFMILSENQPNGDVEGFGIVILEANYFGKPAIGARGCGIEDAIENGKNGFLVDGNNFNEIINAIKECMDKKQILEKTSKKWVEKHNWDNIIGNIVDL